MKEYSVLTILMGNYDILHELPFQNTNENVEFICVTDKKNLTSNTWTIVYDEDLDKKEYNGFDRTFLVRYNPFKYCNSNICIRLDATILPLCDLQDLVSQFVEGNYDFGFCVHPSNMSLINELEVWANCRKCDQRQLQYDYITNVIGYDINKKGLIQNNIAIVKKSQIADEVHKGMINILYDCTDNEGHINRLDQTLLTAFFYKNYDHLKVLPISMNMIKNGKIAQFFHYSNRKVKNMCHKLPNYIFNDEIVEAYE